MKNSLERLCEAVGYPDKPGAGAHSFTMRVDEGDVLVRIMGKRLVLSRIIDRNLGDLPKLASYATGRMLIEDAVLAWDERADACILWQECNETDSNQELVHAFQKFMDSCDWWVARAGELNAPPVVFPDIVIRP